MVENEAFVTLKSPILSLSTLKGIIFFFRVSSKGRLIHSKTRLSLRREHQDLFVNFI